MEAGEDSSLAKYRALPGQIARYYQFYGDLAKSSIKDPAKLTEYLGLMQGWREAAENLGRLIGSEEEINRD